MAMNNNINKIFALTLSGLVALLGIMVLLGWFTGNKTLVQVLPQFVPMQFNTALCFLLIGLGLALAIVKHTKASMALGSIVGLIAALTLAEYIFAINLGIDELFMRHDITVETSHPGRMAPMTAFCFFLAFCYLADLYAWKNVNGNTAIAGCFSLMIFILSLFALAGYLMGIPQTYSWGNLTSMAVHTALGFLCWSIVAVAQVWRTICLASERKSIYRQFFVFFIVSFTFILIWSAMNKNEQRNIGIGLSIAERQLSSNIEKILNLQVDALERSAQRWKQGNNTSMLQWDADAKSYVNDFYALQSMTRTDQYYSKKMIAGIEKNASGSYAITVAVPVQAGDRYLGAVLAVYDFDKLILPVVENETDYYIVWIRYGNEIVLKTHKDVGRSLEHYQQTVNMQIEDMTMQLEMWPTKNTVAMYQSWVSGAMLIVGMLMAMCLAIVFGLLHSIRNLEARNRLILDSAGEGIYELDGSGITQFLNKAAEEMLGWKSDELVGKSQHAMIHHTKSDGSAYPREDCPIYAAYQDGCVHSSDEEVFWRKDGSCFEVEYISHPVRNSKNKVIGSVVTFNDISERKKLERRIMDSKNDVEATNKELESFSYSVSHDLRAPLRHIMGFIDLIEKNDSFKINEAGEKHYRYIQESAEKMGRLIDGLLAFSRTGRVDMEKENVDLNKIAKQSFERLNGDVKDRNINWEFSNLPTVQGDTVLLSSVFDNLLSNAIKFTKNKDVAEIKILADEDKDEYIVKVQDNGVGFDQKYAGKMFGVFQRLHKEQDFPGTGIGLANVQKIINRHGGRIWAQSELEKGTSIFFSVPKDIGDNNG